MNRALFLASLAVVLGGCRRHDDQAAAGGTVAVGTPVGPIPGPGIEPSASPNPFDDDDRVAIAEGRKLFLRYNCAGCHGDHAGGGMGPSLRDEDWIYGDSDAHIFDSIAEGRAHGMPAWGIKLPEQQVWKLVAYIRSMRTDREPEAPR